MSDVFLPVPAEGASPPPLFRVLVVCTANLYRSPLAECLLRERLAAAREVIRVSSAGTHAVPGGPMAAEAASVLAGWGGDPSGTVSRRLTAELVERADLVLGAAAEHREAAVGLSPVRALSRAFTLREFARLLRAEDAADAMAPFARLTSLVRGAAGRRGTERVQGGDDDVADPLGADVRSARQCAMRIEESVNTIAAAMRAGCSPAISSQQRGRRHPSAR
ncbi:low molecular weight phosphatase family protein [Streptomyces sp. WAC 00631]|uniref:arsenate reductase/protein-tyrosine-phosphatase family protein n=1 Tax=Streptomyces sp. WAC 00631 TaxID=2203201 RepID=UPI000F7AAD6E|nr:low molecular weight phosphatase family protein [Streptomyces sp. WAC 00631]MCC5032155.1 low molecular weight phosphatase family protein [Streptomyces sp. WAC 00631]